MISKIYWINEEVVGEKMLGIMPRPRGNDWLEDEIKWLGIRDVDYLISLLENSEANELELEHEAELCEQYNIQFINFPIRDVNVPTEKENFLKLVNHLNEHLNNSKKIVIHCRMGIGRASVLASGILIKRGIKAKDVFKIIGKYRELEVPDTEEQKNWIYNLEKELTQE